jgi:flagellar motor protein MotB
MPIRPPKGFIDENDPKVCQIGHPAPPWLVNYADLMTEMVCFFVILYAMSAALNKAVVNAKAEVEKLMKEGVLQGEVKMDKDGLKISLEEKGQMAFFQSGNADTTPAMEEMVSKLAPVLKDLAAKQDIIVEGHTDNVPIHNEYYDSNWELSTARATSVARLLIDKYGLPPNHLGAIGYGSYREVVPNDTPDHKAKNRRVVFFIKNAPLGGNAKVPPSSGKENASPPTTTGPGPSSAAPAAQPAPAATPAEEAR